jgi:putative membrane protein (TIGR04086 family)
MRWGRAIAGGFLAEVLLIIAVMPGFAMGSEPVVIWTAVIGSAVTTFLAALWVTRTVESNFALHGAVVGLSAAAIYLILITAAGQTQPLIYWVAHGLKVLGGVAGGAFAVRHTAHALLATAAEGRVGK